MAASVQKAQDILNCQLCQVNTKIKWRCEDCQMLMCDNCKINIHPKVKTTFEHNIVDIRNATPQKTTSMPNLNDIPCEIHEQNNCCLFCETCKQLICPTCISKSHKSHNMVELVDILKDKLNLLSAHDRKIKDLLTHFTKELEVLSSTSREANDKFVQQKSYIENREKILHEKVNKYATTLLDGLLENKKTVTEDTEKERHRIQGIINDLEQRGTEIKSVKTSARLRDILSKESEIYECTCISMNKKSEKRFKPKIREFQECSVAGTTLDDAFGFFESPKKHRSDIQINFITDYKLTKLNVPNICGISPLSSTSAWIWTWPSSNPSKLASVQLTGTKVSVRQTVLKTNAIYNFCHVDQSKFIMSVVKDSSLYSFDATKNTSRAIYNFNPLIPKAVCVAGSEIIVGVRDAGEPWPVNASSYRQVVVLSLEDCIVRKVFEYAKGGERMFTLPSRISSRNNDIYVVDSTSDVTGRIVAVDRFSEMKWIYSDPQSKPLFNPSGVVTTETGNIVVGAFDQGNLYVLSQYGRVLTKCAPEQPTLSSISCLGFDQLGRVWIGGKGEDEKACFEIVKVIER